MFNNFKEFIYKHRKILNMFSLITILCTSLTITAYADVGNFSSSASSSSSSSSSNNSSNAGTPTFYSSSNSLNDERNSDHSTSSSVNNTNNSWIVFPFVGGMLLFMGSIAYNQYKANKNGSINSNSSLTANENNEQVALEKISTIDENFDINKFKARTGDMFINLQQAWMNKDWKIVRPYESDNLFNMHSSQMQEFINKHQTNMMESICVKRITLKDFYSNPKTMIDSIEVIIEASFIDYVQDDRTGKVISGNSKNPVFMKYKWTLIRKSGVKSKLDDNGIKSTSCPNCGAPVSIGASGECEYCNSIVTSGDYDWVLSSIEI